MLAGLQPPAPLRPYGQAEQPADRNPMKALTSSSQFMLSLVQPPRAPGKKKITGSARGTSDQGPA